MTIKIGMGGGLPGGGSHETKVTVSQGGNAEG